MAQENARAGKKKTCPEHCRRNESRRRELLFQWTRTVRELFPHARTKNPFVAQLETLYQGLDIIDQLLLSDCITSLTVLNQHDRIKEGKSLISARTDIINALQLVLPQEKRLSELHLKDLEILRKKFAFDPFSKLQAARCLGCSNTTLRRRLYPLIDHGLIERTAMKDGMLSLIHI